MPKSSTSAKRLILNYCALASCALLVACGGWSDKNADERTPTAPLALDPTGSAPSTAPSDAVLPPVADPATLPEAASDEVVVDANASAAPAPTTNPSTPPAVAVTSPPVLSNNPMERGLRLSWVAPHTNDDGTPLTDLSGYRVYLGSTSGSYSQSVAVASAATTNYLFTDLPAGTYYAVVKAVNKIGLESAASAEASKVIR